MGKLDDPKLDEILSANAKAFAALRDIAGDLKSVVEHELMIDESIPKSIEINSQLHKP
jgi:hypothetical protein